MPKILALAGGAAGSVTAPVALTTNVIPKATGASSLADSALTDNGTQIVSSEPLVIPAGATGNNLGALQFSGGVALFRNGTTLAAWQNDIGSQVFGMGEDSSGTVPAVGTTSTGVMGWTNSSTSVATSAVDTAFSRYAAGKAALGNGTSGDKSGTLDLARINVSTVDTNSGSLVIATGDAFSNISLAPGGNGAFVVNNNGTDCRFSVRVLVYNNINLVDSGLVAEVGHLDLTGQTASLAATTIYTPTATGRFRISVYEKVTTAASVSSVLGGASGTTLTYTDGTDSVAQSVAMAMNTAAGAIAITAAGNSTTTVLNGTAYIYALTGVPIQIAVGYTSSGTAMAYAVRATCEML